MSIFQSFVDELQKIAKIPGPSLSRTMGKSKKLDEKIKFLKSMGDPAKAMGAIEERAMSKSHRKGTAEFFKDVRKEVGPAAARETLANTRVIAALSKRMSVKGKSSPERGEKIYAAGRRALGKQSRKELKRELKKGQAPGR